MDPTRLRALGYVLDHDDHWVHPQLKLQLQDPDALLGCDPGALDAFHDGRLWEELEPEPRPHLEGDLAGRVVHLQLSWDGWLRAWELQDGLYVRHEQLLAMGERLETTLSGLQHWQAGHDRRLLGSCLGMLVMVLWLFGGWLLGLPVWLAGMAVIAVATWFIRPRKRPDVLFGELDIDLVPKALDAGREALGEGWEDIADSVAAIPLWGDYIRLSVLERNVAIKRLKQAFEPSDMAGILHTVAPVD